MAVRHWHIWASFLGMATSNLLRFRLRTTVVLLCLLAAAVPLLTALAMQEGLKRQALSMLDAGPDLLVAGDDFGRPCSVPLSWRETVDHAAGVVRVVLFVAEDEARPLQVLDGLVGLGVGHVGPLVELVREDS